MTDGQIDFVPFDSMQDRIYIGKDARAIYDIHGGEAWAPQLKKQFPKAHGDIYRFMKLVDAANAWKVFLLPIKMVPAWLISVPMFSKLISLLTNAFEAFRGQSLKDVVEAVTDDIDLREVLAYRWNVALTPPEDMPFSLAAGAHLHYTKHKSYWPVGGASEIPFHMVPVIEKSGSLFLCCY